MANQIGILSEDELSFARRDDKPQTAVNNLKLLSKTLQAVGIALNTTDIADIVSEVS